MDQDKEVLQGVNFELNCELRSQLNNCSRYILNMHDLKKNDVEKGTYQQLKESYNKLFQSVVNYQDRERDVKEECREIIDGLKNNSKELCTLAQTI